MHFTWSRFLSWLRSAPIDDPVDRRHAPVLQLLLMFYAVLLPAMWAWRAYIGRGLGPHSIVLIDMLTAFLAAVGLTLIRDGKPKIAVRLFIASQLVALAATFNAVGVQSQLIDPAPTMLTLGLAGLVLGRRALWTVWALLLGAFGIGFSTTIALAKQRGIPIDHALRDLPAVLITYSLVTLILDRTIGALRESLRESEHSRIALQQEMEKRERIQSKLLHAQKLEATGRLASGVAHDFNHLLAVMRGLSQRREEWMDQKDPVAGRDAMHWALADIESTADRGLALTRKLLEFSRDLARHAEDTDLAHAVAGSLPLLRHLLPHTITLQTKFTENDLPVRLDRGELELILLNLAANARDAMEGSGELTLTTEVHQGFAQIRIRDSGPGVTEEVSERIFEPFFSTKPDRTGSGLGLPMVRDLLRSHGGEIHLSTPPNTSCEFVLSFPLRSTGQEPTVVRSTYPSPYTAISGSDT